MALPGISSPTERHRRCWSRRERRQKPRSNFGESEQKAGAEAQQSLGQHPHAGGREEKAARAGSQLPELGMLLPPRGVGRREGEG